MISINVKVEKQKSTITSFSDVFSGASKYNTISFTLDSEWSNKTITAYFWREDKNLYTNTVSDNSVIIPDIVLVDPGYVWCALRGVYSTTIITSQSIKFFVKEGIISGAVVDSGSSPIVRSVNGKTGAVTLSASDVGALPVGTTIPSKTSDLTNNSGFITSSYHDSTKQNVITDLDTIRSGAKLGATALQSVPSTYRTAKQQDVIDATKQDKLTAGTGIKIQDCIISIDNKEFELIVNETLTEDKELEYTFDKQYNEIYCFLIGMTETGRLLRFTFAKDYDSRYSKTLPSLPDNYTSSSNLFYHAFKQGCCGYIKCGEGGKSNGVYQTSNMLYNKLFYFDDGENWGIGQTSSYAFTASKGTQVLIYGR